MLEGEVEVVADGERYTLAPGDVFWTGVGCVHAFYNTSGKRVTWLETSAPGPPDRHSYRFDRDWDYLESRLESEKELEPRRRDRAAAESVDVGFAGLGRMGAPMARRVLGAGLPADGLEPDRPRAATASSSRAQRSAASPRALAERARGRGDDGRRCRSLSGRCSHGDEGLLAGIGPGRSSST